jgi:hypothetical protein
VLDSGEITGKLSRNYKQPLQDFLAAVRAPKKEKVKKDVTVAAS